jgi:uncharacterized membrane protein
MEQTEAAMAHAEGSITIERDVKTVFDFLLDGTNGPKWRQDVTDAQLQAGDPRGVGAVYRQGMKGPGGRIAADYEIVECRPNEWIKFQVVAGPARPVGTYKLEALGKSTRVTFVLDYQPKGLARLMDGMINKSMQAEVGNLANLRAHLESVQAA